jgi:hypothetical protein
MVIRNDDAYYDETVRDGERVRVPLGQIRNLKQKAKRMSKMKFRNYQPERAGTIYAASKRLIVRMLRICMKSMVCSRAS